MAKKREPVLLNTDLIDSFYCGVYATNLLKASVEDGGVGFGDIVQDEIYLWAASRDTSMYLSQLNDYSDIAKMSKLDVVEAQTHDLQVLRKIVRTVKEQPPSAFSVSMQTEKYIHDLLDIFAKCSFRPEVEAFFQGLSTFLSKGTHILQDTNPTESNVVAGWRVYRSDDLSLGSSALVMDTPTDTRLFTVVEEYVKKQKTYLKIASIFENGKMHVVDLELTKNPSIVDSNLFEALLTYGKREHL